MDSSHAGGLVLVLVPVLVLFPSDGENVGIVVVWGLVLGGAMARWSRGQGLGSPLTCPANYDHP